MRKRVGVVGVSLIALALVGCDTSSSRSGPTTATSARPAIEHNACWSAVDALSNEISAATNASDIPTSSVLASFRACGEAASWKKYADIDQIDDEISGLGDTSGPFTASTALEFLCVRFEKQRNSETCRLR